MSSSNGCWYKKPGWIVTVLGGLTLLVGGYAVMGYQVGDHEVRIKTIETEDKAFKLDYTEQMTRVETIQETIQTDIGKINKGIEKILLREVGTGP